MKPLVTEEVVTKSNWKMGLFCVGCGKRIVFGHTAFWVGQEAYGKECMK